MAITRNKKRELQTYVLKVLIKQAGKIKRLPSGEKREAGRQHLRDLIDWLGEQDGAQPK